MKVFKGILLGLSILILGITVLNIYTYYSDVKEIQKLEKEKLRLEIQILKSKLVSFTFLSLSINN